MMSSRVAISQALWPIRAGAAIRMAIPSHHAGHGVSMCIRHRAVKVCQAAAEFTNQRSVFRVPRARLAFSKAGPFPDFFKRLDKVLPPVEHEIFRPLFLQQAAGDTARGDGMRVDRRSVIFVPAAAQAGPPPILGSRMEVHGETCQGGIADLADRWLHA
jgi:hypothetical protein